MYLLSYCICIFYINVLLKLIKTQISCMFDLKHQCPSKLSSRHILCMPGAEYGFPPYTTRAHCLPLSFEFICNSMQTKQSMTNYSWAHETQ